MQGPEHWSIPERYMVRYHLSHLLWWALASVCVVILAFVAVVAMTSARILHPTGSSTNWWYSVFIATPVLTAASFGVREFFLRRIAPDWTLYRAVNQYKRAMTTTLLVCALAGILPAFVAITYREFSYPLLITVIPLAALVFHFPHNEKFHLLMEDLTHGRQ